MILMRKEQTRSLACAVFDRICTSLGIKCCWWRQTLSEYIGSRVTVNTGEASACLQLTCCLAGFLIGNLEVGTLSVEHSWWRDEVRFIPNFSATGYFGPVYLTAFLPVGDKEVCWWDKILLRRKRKNTCKKICQAQTVWVVIDYTRVILTVLVLRLLFWDV